jgi:hypothetical protein
VWNAPLAQDAALDPNSGAIVGELNRQVQQGLAHGSPPAINTSSYSTPIYTVGADQKRVHVALDQPASNSPELRQAFAEVPIPQGARPAAGTDAQLTVWQPRTDTIWEFWRLRQAPDGWHAVWGGRMTGVSTDPGFYTGAQANWGATATDLPLAGGLVTLADLRRGRIDHALSFAVNTARAGAWAWPAQHSDGGASGSNTVPEGARFRLDPAVDVASLNLPPLVRMIAEAAQHYGMIVRDTGGSIAFYGEDPGPTGADPYPALLSGLASWDALRGFPWNRLQLVRMQLVTSGGGGVSSGPVGLPLPQL